MTQLIERETFTDQAVLELEGLLADHLKYNNFPPVTSLMIDPCKESIFHILEGDFDYNVEVGNHKVNVCQIAEDLNLDWFIDVWPDVE